jgi:large subunit ribosomal protein L25
MTEVVVQADKRTVLGSSVKALRRQGFLPAILYGSGVEPTPLQLDAHEASKILSTIGASTLVTLKVGKELHQVLVREIQRDYIRSELIHVDFLKVAMDVVIRAEVPVELIGESPAVKELGGLLVGGLSEIEVEALPSDLPDRVTVDVSALAEMDDVITVGDVDFEEGVEVLTSSDEVIASIVYQAEEIIEEEELVEELVAEVEEPEVIERGKREEEEGEETTGS